MLMPVNEFREKYYCDPPHIKTMRKWIRDDLIPGGVIQGNRYFVNTEVFEASFITNQVTHSYIPNVPFHSL